MIQVILVILSVITLVGGAIGTVDDAAPMFSAVILVFLLWKSFYDYRKSKETAEEIRTLKDMLEQNDRGDPNLQKSETEYLQNSNGNAAYNKQG